MRLRAVRQHLEGDEMFLANYSDGLCDLNLDRFVADFKASGKTASFLSVPAPYTFHIVQSDVENHVTRFEAIGTSHLRVNGGFFALRREIFNVLQENEDLVAEPFERLIAKRELLGVPYDGFWRSMDTFKDRMNLEELWGREKAPWKVGAEPDRPQSAMSGTPRQLLLLTQHFPPSGEVAGRVTARLLRHLAAFGWQTTVLTIAEQAIVGPIDRAAYADVLASLRVERVARWPRVLDLLNKARPRRARAAAPGAPAPRPGFFLPVAGRSRLVRYLTFPDSKTGWVAPAVLRGRQLLREQRFDALLTISPPHSTHLAGLALHRLFPEVPWIAQLHDPWVSFDAPPSDWALQRGASYLERQVLSAADEVLLATDEARSRYLARYPELPPGKLGVLVNGYDPVDFPPAAPRRADDRDCPTAAVRAPGDDLRRPRSAAVSAPDWRR